jgi:hypothetical protein
MIPVAPDAPTDFDFLIGRWRVAHRRLNERLKGCSQWASFGGLCVSHRVLGGFGNVDDNLLDLPSGPYRAVTMRAFDPAQSSWSIWWLDGRRPGTLDVPMVGRFADGVGSFYADDMLDGRPIRVRFRWTLPLPDAPRWEQAFSADAGSSWEINWIMDFERLP